MMRLALVSLVLMTVGIASGQTPVMPSDVARSAADHYPQVLAATAERRAAVGGQLSARGAFDTQLKSSARSRLEGFYSGDTASVDLTKPLGPLGAEVFGGYRISQGDFPIYEDYSFTNQGGEASVGVLFSLLRDRAIDSRRAGLAEADLDLSEADLNLLLTRIETQADALTAYWAWVAKGRELAAYEELLALAERRDVALRREVSSGARAEIFLTENAQNLTQRREFVRRAERDLALAANRLSLYFRGSDGDPIAPTRAMLPADVPLPDDSTAVSPERLLASRPDLLLLDVARQRLELQRDLARNDLQPSLDVRVEASNDFGAIGPGGVSRDPGELIAGVTLTVPLGRREARGRLRTADAELEALLQERRLLRERIVQELRNIVITLTTAEELQELTEQEAGFAETMREAERERFRGGASDFFLVNLREQAAANAKVRLAQAEFAVASARIAFQAATMDTDRLSTGE